jgi:hypothetical protein
MNPSEELLLIFSMRKEIYLPARRKKCFILGQEKRMQSKIEAQNWYQPNWTG